MHAEQPIVLFGIRSPIVVEFEETCSRRGITVTAGINLGGSPRLASNIDVISVDDFVPVAGTRFYACAFSPDRRRALVDQGIVRGMQLADALIDPSAVMARSVRFGTGSFANAGVVIGALCHIGTGVLVNRSASIGHHCVVGDYVSIGPGATLAGNIHVGEGCMIGAGAVILPDLRIGAGAVVAAGSVVRAHVKAGSLVAGNPARVRPFDPVRSSLNTPQGE